MSNKWEYFKNGLATITVFDLKNLTIAVREGVL